MYEMYDLSGRQWTHWSHLHYVHTFGSKSGTGERKWFATTIVRHVIISVMHITTTRHLTSPAYPFSAIEKRDRKSRARGLLTPENNATTCLQKNHHHPGDASIAPEDYPPYHPSSATNTGGLSAPMTWVMMSWQTCVHIFKYCMYDDVFMLSQDESESEMAQTLPAHRVRRSSRLASQTNKSLAGQRTVRKGRGWVAGGWYKRLLQCFA